MNSEVAGTVTSNLTSNGGRDFLLDALVSLTVLHQQPCSADSLVAGLPLKNGQLTPEMFVRAAERAGFKSRYLERALPEISELVLPVALQLTDGETCILLEKHDSHGVILFPGAEEVQQEISLEKLADQYEGHCFFLKPDYDAGKQNEDSRKHWFWDTIKKSRTIYLEVIVASLLINLFALVTPLFVMNVYDRVVPNYAVETLWVLASGVTIVFVFDLIMKGLRGYFIDVAGKRADILLSSQTFARVMDMQMEARPPRVGSFANNLQEFDTFREFFTSTTLIALIDLPFVVLFILLIYGIGGPLAFVPLIAIPLVVGISFLIQRPLQAIIDQTFSESSKKHGLLIESLTGMDAIKGARAEGAMQRKWEDFNGRLAKLSLKSRILSQSTINFTQLVQQLATVATVVSGVYLIMDAQLSVGGLIACTIMTGRCLAPMGQLAAIVTRYHHSIAAYKTVDKLMNLPVERPETRSFVHRQNLQGSIEFREVGFTYSGQQVPALKNLSFKIAAGEKVAIIGKMGSGKSTLQRLIMKFYQPTEGSVLISGTDINQLDPAEIRKHCIYVPQDPMLFSGTIRDNIMMGSPLADDQQVIKATEFAGLADFVNNHPQGFDLQVGERGSQLSGGQRQAVAIARAFLHDAPMMVLDEPTNAMDNTAEANFRAHLQQYMQERTLVLITHKTTMLPLVDRIILLNDGVIVADGHRDEVLKALAGGARAQG